MFHRACVMAARDRGELATTVWVCVCVCVWNIWTDVKLLQGVAADLLGPLPTMTPLWSGDTDWDANLRTCNFSIFVHGTGLGREPQLCFFGISPTWPRAKPRTLQGLYGLFHLHCCRNLVFGIFHSISFQRVVRTDLSERLHQSSSNIYLFLRRLLGSIWGCIYTLWWGWCCFQGFSSRRIAVRIHVLSCVCVYVWCLSMTEWHNSPPLVDIALQSAGNQVQSPLATQLPTKSSVESKFAFVRHYRYTWVHNATSTFFSS